MYTKIPPEEVRTVVRKPIFKPCSVIAVEGTLKGWRPGAFEEVYVQLRFNGAVTPLPLCIGHESFWKDEGFAIRLCPFPFDKEGELLLAVINQTKLEIDVRCGLIMGDYVTGIQ